MRVFITGSSDGIGLAAANNLIKKGHSVTLHARNADRAAQAKARAPGASAVLVADISTLAGMKQLAADANDSNGGAGGGSPFDVIVHNAGVGYGATVPKEPTTADGFGTTFAVNTLAPYVLTCLVARPAKAIIYLSSDSHMGGDDSLEDIEASSGYSAYADSKLHDTMLAFAVARRWAGVVSSNAVDPGWVSTKMGGSMAAGSVADGADTITWLAESEGGETGKLFGSRRVMRPHAGATVAAKQDKLMSICERLSGVAFKAD